MLWQLLLRTLRALKACRLLSKSQAMRRVLSTIISSLATLGHVSFLLLLMLITFALLGMQLFSGRFGDCTDPAIDTRAACVGSFMDPGTGQVLPRVWTDLAYNYDHFGNALVAMFVSLSLNGYRELVLEAVGVNGDGDSGHVSAAAGLAVRQQRVSVYFFFMSFIALVCFVLLKLYIGFLYDTYRGQHEEKELRELGLSAEQHNWLQLARRIYEMRPRADPMESAAAAAAEQRAKRRTAAAARASRRASALKTSVHGGSLRRVSSRSDDSGSSSGASNSSSSSGGSIGNSATRDAESPSSQVVAIAARRQQRWRRRRLQERCLRLVTHQRFKTTMAAVVSLNAVILSLQWYSEPPQISTLAVVSSVCFTCIYVAEVALRVVGFGGWRGFLIKHDAGHGHKALVVLAALAVADVVLQLAAAAGGGLAGALGAFQLLRLMRVFRGVDALLLTFLDAVPAMLRLGSVLVVVIYMYAYAATVLFGRVAFQVRSSLFAEVIYLVRPLRHPRLNTSSCGLGEGLRCAALLTPKWSVDWVCSEAGAEQHSPLFNTSARSHTLALALKTTTVQVNLPCHRVTKCMAVLAHPTCAHPIWSGRHQRARQLFQHGPRHSYHDSSCDRRQLEHAHAGSAVPAAWLLKRRRQSFRQQREQRRRRQRLRLLVRPPVLHVLCARRPDHPVQPLCRLHPGGL